MINISFMNKEEICQKLLERGFTYEPKTGDIFNSKGRKLTYKDASTGYYRMVLSYEKKKYKISGHQFAFYCGNGYVPNFIDHINRVRDDNRIENLREVESIMINSQNRIGKGYSYHKVNKKYQAQINILGKKIFIGNFDTEDEARNAYLKYKNSILSEI